jgi:hypothetical protein
MTRNQPYKVSVVSSATTAPWCLADPKLAEHLYWAGDHR